MDFDVPEAAIGTLAYTAASPRSYARYGLVYVDLKNIIIECGQSAHTSVSHATDCAMSPHSSPPYSGVVIIVLFCCWVPACEV